MKNFTISFFFLLFTFSQLNAQGIFDASIHTAVEFGFVNSPFNEGVQQIIDQDPSTKFLDFEASDGIGFEVDLLGVSTTINSMEMVTANDAPERDPTNFEISGSDDGVNYTIIAEGSIPCVADRFLSRIFTFSNTAAYTFYRINFTGTCSPSDINQIADVQLYETIGNAPVFSCPVDMTIDNSAGQCEAIGSFDITVEDVEDGTLTPTQILGNPSGSSFPIGTSPIVFSATDSDGNTVSCEFSITVVDSEAPVFDCPSDMTVTTPNIGDPSTLVDYDVLVSDNCSTINPLDDYTSLGTIDGKSYYLADTLVSADVAFFNALVLDGFVGTIRDSAANAYLLDAILRNNNGVANVTIGYNDIDVEGTFVWQSGDFATYNNWNMNEPNNSGSGGIPENYTIMLTDGKWNDVDELGARRYLLELDYELLQTQGLESGSAFPVGTTTNIFEATDAVGNFHTCEFDITVENPVSTEDLILKNGISISPNPTNDLLTIENLTDIPLERITIYDTYGKALYSNNTKLISKKQTISIGDFPSGFYLLEIKGEQGITTKKLIKL